MSDGELLLKLLGMGAEGRQDAAIRDAANAIIDDFVTQQRAISQLTQRCEQQQMMIEELIAELEASGAISANAITERVQNRIAGASYGDATQTTCARCSASVDTRTTVYTARGAVCAQCAGTGEETTCVRCSTGVKTDTVEYTARGPVCAECAPHTDDE